MRSDIKYYHGLIIFAVVIICMLFIAVPLQYYFGIYGLAFTELMLMAIAFSSAGILKLNFKKVFASKLPPIHCFFAALFLYTGIYIFTLLVLLTTEFFFPSINDVGEAIVSIGTGTTPWVSLFIMAVLPAVCEEILHRGIILYSFKHIKNTAVITICMGVIFGLFHLDPYRFLSTALLGGTFAYFSLKTDSLFLPMLFHFITNAVSVFAMFSVDGADVTANTATLSHTGMTLSGLWLVMGSIALPAIYTGIMIFNYKSIKSYKTTVIIIISALMLLSGIILSYIGFSDTDYFKNILDEMKI
jgi:membrane protease YdiL (CAAX protease family)